jgi:predicted RNA binding protein YcfA (HicA-like mRNA interferase family)
MPPKFANLKPEQVIRALKKGGFFIHETSGSHVQMKHPTKPGRVTILITNDSTYPNTS